MTDSSARLVTADEGLARVAAGARLIDVRSDAGREANGAYDGATVVLKTDVEAFAATIDNDEELVVFCGSVDGSGPVVAWLADHGFERVVHVDGGFDALRAAAGATD